MTASPGLLQESVTTECYFSMKENNLICGRTWTQEVFRLRRPLKSWQLGKQRRAGGAKGNKTKQGGSSLNLPHQERAASGKKPDRKSRPSHCKGPDRKRIGFSGSDPALHLLGVQSSCGSVEARLKLVCGPHFSPTRQTLTQGWGLAE